MSDLVATATYGGIAVTRQYRLARVVWQYWFNERALRLELVDYIVESRPTARHRNWITENRWHRNHARDSSLKSPERRSEVDAKALSAFRELITMHEPWGVVTTATASAKPSIRTSQCASCPWRKSTIPDRDIPNGYCSTKHANLKSTIAEPGILRAHSAIRIMACHESRPGREQPCVGWLENQLGPGNNIALRIEAMDGRYKDVRTDGPQHERFEDTLSRKRRKR